VCANRIPCSVPVSVVESPGQAYRLAGRFAKIKIRFVS
jgi:hypothetical protein